MRYIILLLVFASFSLAQPLSLGKPNEEKKHSPWLNLGIGLGALGPVSSPSYKKQGEKFFNPSLLAGIQFLELTAVTLEFDITVPDGGFGGWVGLEQQFLESSITPFAEVQVGAKNPGYDKRDLKFGDVFGVATSLNGGLIFFREEFFRLRLKGGYEMIFNKHYDMSWKAAADFFFALGRPGLETIKVN